MLQPLERTGCDNYGTRATPAPLKANSQPELAHLQRDEARAAAVAHPKRDGDVVAAAVTPEQDGGLLVDDGPTMMAAYGLVLAVAALTFKGSGPVLLAVAVCIASCSSVCRWQRCTPLPARCVLAEGRRAPLRHGRHIHRPRQPRRGCCNL